MTLPPWAVFLGAGAGASLLFVVGNATISAVAWSGVVLAALGALGAHVLRYRTSRTGPWSLLLVGFTVYAAATMPWYLVPASGHPLPFPSLVDAGFFLSYAVFAAALLSLARRHRDHDARASLEVVIVAIGAGTPLWEFLLKPEVVDQSWLVTLTLYGYPLVLLVLLGMTIRLLLLVDRPDGAGLLLIGWIVGELVADVYYAVSVANGTFRLDSPFLLLYLASYT
ncbi:MAG: hypothetical protein H0U35_12510, partial [Sporichthyaceae bacterium]|nr:hypothetical protein [Sporichthyaceae bacterium]